MPITPGTRIGACEIAEVIGAGGMGEVYRALDTTLDREVAIKVLPESFVTDADRVARFEREAKVLASLNHANIAQIHGLERSSGTLALVMELVEGPTLADRLLDGPLPPDEALAIALQIADALEAAHGQGIVHRDLKPANIKVKPDGAVKVLDFGIAKALESPVTISGRPIGVLATPAMTETGMILGTAAYMSPEQARGRPVDQRADIWAFGCVLYEMLTGQKAFAGEDVATTLAKIFERDTDVASLPSVVSPAIRRTLQLCLQKDPKQRIADIRDVRFALRGVFESAAPAKPAKFPWLAASGLAALGLLLGGAGVWGLKPAAAPPAAASAPAPIRVNLDLAEGRRLSSRPDVPWLEGLARQRPTLSSFALSPDGRYLVYAATDGETTRLYRRRLDQREHTPIPGTEGGAQPFFSPDGRSVGFRVGNDLKRVPLDGGDVRTIGTIGPLALSPGAWTTDDTILFTGRDGVYELTANGGRSERLTQFDLRTGERSHRFPQMLPERRGVLFETPTRLNATPSEDVIMVQPLDGGPRKVLIEGGSDARYLPSGHLVFARRGALWAAPFDAARLEVTGAPVVVIDDVMQAERAANGPLDTGAAQFSVSTTGSLAYVPGGMHPGQAFSLTWVGHSGTAEPLPLPPALYAWPRLSPDGTRLAYVSGNFGDYQLWVYDIALEVPVRLADAGNADAPVWSPDGTRLAFTRPGEGLYWMFADGRGTPQPIGGNDGTGRLRIPSSWSIDDVLAFVGQRAPNEPMAIWTVRMDGASEPAPFIQADSGSAWPFFSPDGRWLAYSFDAGGTGLPDVYVRPFPEGGPLQRISTGGGAEPTWSSDGRRLFYRAPVPSQPDTRRWMVVDVVTEPQFTRGRPRPLFEGDYGGAEPVRNYDVAPDGERFVMVRPLEAPPEPVTSIEFVLNWFTELEERVPTP